LKKRYGIAVAGLCLLLGAQGLKADGFGVPSKKWGIGFGNSKQFTGIRFNYRDHHVEKVNGINFTLWQPRDKEGGAEVNGLSLGLIPGGKTLRGVQLGVLGVMGMENVSGITVGLLGAGAGGDMTGINIGGLGCGAGGSMRGVNFGALGLGAGEDLWGINLGGLGCGAGENVKGINIGLLGLGAGSDLWGINIGGLGCGAGENVTGFTVALLGAGAGERMAGLQFSGIGLGAGEELWGLSLAGVAAGSPKVTGITIAGVAVGGVEVRGIAMAVGCVRIVDDKMQGSLTGVAVSSCNWIKGEQRGLSIGILNYATKLNGIQLGLINIAKNNPKGAKVLPFVNAHF